MTLNEFWKETLPTPLSSRVAIASWTLATALLFLPVWWQKIGLDPTDQPTLCIRLCGVTTILFLGSSICLALAIRHYRNPPSQKPIIPQDTSLEDVQEKLLQLLISHPGITSQEISSAIGKSAEFVTFHFTEMERAKLVHGSYFADGETEWSIAQGGRAYLALHGLLA